jgi:hypothetical protein
MAHVHATTFGAVNRQCRCLGPLVQQEDRESIEEIARRIVKLRWVEAEAGGAGEALPADS